MRVVRFCAIECRLQESGEVSVWWMLNAWRYAKRHAKRRPSEGDVFALGEYIEPIRNAPGYRMTGVRVGMSIKPQHDEVPGLMRNLFELRDDLEAAEFFRQYEEIHPFVDGNGRSGALLFNWLRGTLDDPDWPPNFWDDQRRLTDAGAPRISIAPDA